MKRTILIGLLALVLSLALGCANPNAPAPSPSPLTPTMPLASPSPLASAPAESINPAVTDNGAGGTGAIEGFEEGKTVKESELPQKVADAIKEAYNDVKIKTITYVTYMNDQVYHVVLEKPAGNDKVEQFYVKSDGTIIPYNPSESPGGTTQS